MRSFKKDARIQVGVLVLIGLVAVAATNHTQGVRGGRAKCASTSTGLVPLTDLGSGTYRGYQGGLYPDGKNTPPASYLQAGAAAAKLVRPLDAAGHPAPDGQIVLLSIGMSNASYEFAVFHRLALADDQRNRSVKIVNGARSKQTADIISTPSAPYWSTLAPRLAAAGVSAAQVQAVWLKEAIRLEANPFPQDAEDLQTGLSSIISILQQRFPNLHLIYVSSRTYGGYASTLVSPEPFAYETGFAVKWLIQSRIDGNVTSPWVAWGPYLWTDGTRGRSDGLVWTCQDTQSDGTHPSQSGRLKVANLLLSFFKTDPTARPWYLASGGSPPPGTNQPPIKILKNVRYGTAGGRRLLLDAYVPSTTGRARPGVIFVHGGGWRSGDKSDLAAEAAQIARLGWVGFSINYRLEPPSKFPATIADTLAAIKWIRAHPGRFGVLPKELAVVGASVGGNLAALAATEGRGSRTAGSRVAAAVSWSGPMDLAALAARRSSLVARAVEAYIGCTPSACPTRYKHASPVTFVDRSDAPMLIANSRQEVIPLAQAKTMAGLLASAHVPYQLVVLAGQKHALGYTKVIWKPTLKFLERFLGRLPKRDYSPPRALR